MKTLKKLLSFILTAAIFSTFCTSFAVEQSTSAALNKNRMAVSFDEEGDVLFYKEGELYFDEDGTIAFFNEEEAELAREVIAEDRQINDLFAERQRVWTSLMAELEWSDGLYANNKCRELEQELDEIDRQLSKLGVEEIDPQSIDLASHPELAPFVMADGNNADYQWTNTTKQVIYKGKRYMVSNLTVWPNSRNSKLYFDGTKVMYASPDKAAGTLALMKSLVMTYAGLSTIAGTALNFIDLVATQTSAQLSSSTIIEDVTAVYQWMLTEYVTFQYVRESGTSDERLCFTFNRVEGPQKCDVHQVKFNGKKVEMGFQTAEYKIAAIDFDQTDTYHAISAYLSTYEPTTKFIKEIDILGIDNQKVAAIPMLLPIGPGVLI